MICESCKQWNAANADDDAPNAADSTRSKNESPGPADYSYALLLGSFSMIIVALFALIGLAVYGFQGFVVGGVVGFVVGVILFTISIKM